MKEYFTAQETHHDYYKRPRNEIKSLVNTASVRILDVGCAAGVLAGALKSEMNAEVWGIEINPEAASEAENKIDKLINETVENAIEILPDKYFDTIIFADVLEHLPDPENVLSRMKKKLSANGEIIASIPNIRHWSTIKMLLNGLWEYEDYGIMDRTHLKFFTKSSFISMSSNAGFWAASVTANLVEYEDIPDSLLKVCSEIGIDEFSLKDESKHFQYIFKLKQIPDLNSENEENVFFNTGFAEIEKLLKDRKLDSAVEVLTSIINRLEEVKDKLNEYFVIMYSEKIKEMIKNIEDMIKT